MEPLIFHIAEGPDWRAALGRGVYLTSTRGRSLDEVGFIHCSHRHQVEPVANFAYRDVTEPLWLLTVDPDRLGATELREEPAGGVETFPHLYGPLPVGAVVKVTSLEPAAGGLFVAAESWLSPKLSVRPSPIEGLGLFAVDTIEAGEPTGVIGGEVITDAQLAQHAAAVARYRAVAIDEGLHVRPGPDDPLSRGNHGCDPNLWMAAELTVIARRTIQPGEEATIDYALVTVDETWTMSCRCGAAGCRHTLTGSDWRLPELQTRYRGHFSPFIERRLANGFSPPG